MTSFLQNQEAIEFKIIVHQLLTKVIQEKSFVSNVRRLLAAYNLPTIYDLIKKICLKNRHGSNS